MGARLVSAMVLWAGPGSVLLAAGVLLLNAGHFDHGPGVPTAGRQAAWDAMWLALLLLAVGHAVSLIANLVWLIVKLRAGRAISVPGWCRLVYHALVAVPLLVLVFGR